MKKISFEGKKVSIGIDVHKHQYTVTCVCDGVGCAEGHDAS